MSSGYPDGGRCERNGPTLWPQGREESVIQRHDLFGTDGIRGTTEPAAYSERSLLLTPELALRVGQAAGRLAVRELSGGAAPAPLVLGRDPRISGQMLESALLAGLLSQGVDVLCVGVIPTPGVAHLACRLGAPLGIVISASHNPAGDNGIKFFGGDGYKLADDLEATIEANVNDSQATFLPQPSRDLGRRIDGQGLQRLYAHYLQRSWRAEHDLSGLHVVLDCADGATAHLAPAIFRRLGAQVTAVASNPDGLNINQSYEYITPRRLADTVMDLHADVGIAFDGDGDRVIMVDERGCVIDGDAMMGILARHMKERGQLPGDVVVTTSMSNFGLHDSLAEIGVQVVETRVGDRWVMAEMLACKATLGGERSGHILIFDRDQTTGDGIYTALAMLAASVDAGPRASLSTLAAQVPHYPQFIESAAVPPAKPPLEGVDGVQRTVAWLRDRLGADADINVRYSGTEDKLRLSVRARAAGDADAMAEVVRQGLDRLVAAIVAHVGGPRAED